MEQFAIAESLKAHFSEEVLDSVSHQGQVGVVVRPERIVKYYPGYGIVKQCA